MNWTADEMKSIQLDTKNPRINNFRKHFLTLISENSGRSEVFRNAAEVFKNWDGVHNIKAAGPDYLSPTLLSFEPRNIC